MEAYAYVFYIYTYVYIYIFLAYSATWSFKISKEIPNIHTLMFILYRNVP